MTTIDGVANDWFFSDGGEPARIHGIPTSALRERSEARDVVFFYFSIQCPESPEPVLVEGQYQGPGTRKLIQKLREAAKQKQFLHVLGELYGEENSRTLLLHSPWEDYIRDTV